MTAQVIPHPALRLAERIEKKRAELEDAEHWAADLRRPAVRDYSEWNPELSAYPDAQDIAADEAEQAAAWLRKELADLEAQADGAA